MADRALSMPVGAVIGQPVAHSLSPKIFSLLGKKLSRPVAYGSIEVSPARLKDFFRAARGSGIFVGFNVTLPHKERMAALVDKLSPEARAIGAVNVVRFSSGKCRGFNTDWLGAGAALRDRRRSWKGRRAVILGAGGAARALAFALGREGFSEVAVTARTFSRAATLAAAMQRHFRRTRFVAVRSVGELPFAADLVVNGTPVGLKGEPWKLPFPPRLAPGAMAFDLLYARGPTPFLRAAARRGLRGFDGTAMLVAQAVATWEIWFGPVKQGAVLRRHVAARLYGG